MHQWSRRLHSVNKSSGHRWSPIPKPPPPHVDRLCGTHSVLHTLRACYLAAGRQHPHRRELRRLFVRDFRLAQSSVEETRDNSDDADNSSKTGSNHSEKAPIVGGRNVSGDMSAGDSHDDVVWVPPQYLNLRRIVRLARAMGLDVQPVERRELVRLCGERRNQNVVLEVSSFMPKEVVACPWHTRNSGEYTGNEKERISHDVVLFLDHIIDPGNVGAIMRSAFFLGVQRVVLSCDSAGCTAAVSRASAGFMEHMNVYRSVVPTVTFLENTIAQHRARDKARKLEVYAAIATPGHTAVHDSTLKQPEEQREAAAEEVKGHPRRRIVLLGNEDQGLPRDVVRLCTHSVHVPSLRSKPRQPQGAVTSDDEKAVLDTAVLRPQEVSLNVSAASAVILTQLLAGRHAVEVRPIC